MASTLQGCLFLSSFFFFNDTATTEIYTLSLHDALPIWKDLRSTCPIAHTDRRGSNWIDRKSTRLNSSHLVISYAVFCLKKKARTESLAQDLGKRFPLDPHMQPLGLPAIQAQVALDRRTRASGLNFFFLKTPAPPGSTPFPHNAAFRF